MKLLISQSNVMFCMTAGDVPLARFVMDFIRDDTMARQANTSIEGAQHAHPGLVKRLLKSLLAEDFEAKLLVCRKYKHNIDDSMAEWIKENPGHLDHAVIQVNMMVIDICRLRMGNKYDLPLSYPRKELDKHWHHVEDVTHLATMTSDHAIHLLKMAQDAMRGNYERLHKEYQPT